MRRIVMAYDRKAKEFGYMRVGIYEVGNDKKTKNICDIHMFGGDSTLLHNVRYSGPSQSASQAAPERKEREIEKWHLESEVSDAHDIAEGGVGMLYHVESIDTQYCWLFGPLKYDGRGYGSLVLDLIRWKNPTWKFLKDKNKATGHVYFKFPSSRSFQPCGMYHTDLATESIVRRVRNRDPHLMALLKEYRQHLRQVPLPGDVRRTVWRLEATANRQSQYQFMTARG